MNQTELCNRLKQLWDDLGKAEKPEEELSLVRLEIADRTRQLRYFLEHPSKGEEHEPG